MSVIAIFLLISMLLVLWLDITSYTIPNWLVVMLLLAYPFAVMTTHAPVDWKMALAGMGVVFVVGYIVFAMKWMGGGDIKLITACALWVGFANLADFIMLFALLGGVLSIGVWLMRKGIGLMGKRSKPWPRILRDGEPVPYGLAIAGGFLMMMKDGKIPAMLQ